LHASQRDARDAWSARRAALARAHHHPREEM